MTTSIARLPGVIRQACAVSNVPQGQFYPHKPLFPHLSRSELSRAPSRHAAPRTFSDSARRTTAAPKSKDRGPISEEKTTTDFGALNVLGSVPPPTTSIDACLPDGFLFDSGLKVRDGAGCLLVAGEVFSWRPWEKPAMGGTKDQVRGMINEQGQWHVAEEAWAVLAAVWPKPDLIVLGLGAATRPISPKTRGFLNALGMRIEVQDTRNAASQFNLLATERGTSEVAAAMLPVGWKG